MDWIFICQRQVVNVQSLRVFISFNMGPSDVSCLARDDALLAPSSCHFNPVWLNFWIQVTKWKTGIAFVSIIRRVKIHLCLVKPSCELKLSFVWLTMNVRQVRIPMVAHLILLSNAHIETNKLPSVLSWYTGLSFPIYHRNLASARIRIPPK